MPTQELSSQLSPAEERSADSFPRSHKVGQAPTGPKRLSNRQLAQEA